MHVAAMSEYEDQKAKLNFSSDIDYYDTTDFALLSAEVDNDAWIGCGDAMATLAILRSDGTGEQVYIPVGGRQPAADTRREGDVPDRERVTTGPR